MLGLKLNNVSKRGPSSLAIEIVSKVLSGVLNTLRLRQNGRHFADAIFKCIFLNENVWILIKISLKFVPRGPINYIPALVQIMAGHRPGDKPLSGPMMVRLPTIYASLGLNELSKLLMWVCNIITVMSHEHHGVPKHQQHDCLFSNLFRLISRKTKALKAIHRWLDSPHKGLVMQKLFHVMTSFIVHWGMNKLALWRCPFQIHFLKRTFCNSDEIVPKVCSNCQ